MNWNKIRPMLSLLSSHLKLGIQYFAIGYCVTHFGVNVTWCVGPSMEPTINDNDLVLVDRLSILRGDPIERNQLVIFRNPLNPVQMICKRVVAIDGDKVRMSFFDTKEIPVGHVWLEGDNKTRSKDSREYGAVPIGLIVGRVVYRIYPLKNAGKLE